MIYQFNLQDAVLRGFEKGFAIGEERGFAIGVERGIAIGEERGKQRAKLRIAKNMLRENLPVEMISRVTDLPISEINKLKAAPNAN
jgi:predicted transposase/invertase (TIGR01784 family)